MATNEVVGDPLLDYAELCLAFGPDELLEVLVCKAD
jgi:hypothetical protein